MIKIKEIYKLRRKRLLDSVKKSNSIVQQGAILLFANFESESSVFRQESSFYYLTGINEPGIALLIDFSGKETLFVGRFSDNRAQWTNSNITADAACAKSCTVDGIDYWGNEVKGYAFPLLFGQDDCVNLAQKVQELAQAGALYVLNSPKPTTYVQQKIALERLERSAGIDASRVHDISEHIASMRRTKSKDEIEEIYKAIELTMIAQEGAAAALEEGKKECEIQAGIEYVFKESCADIAFPSIVATGANATVLHYCSGSSVIKKNDLVIVDIGARYNHYCADLTRTYPASGTFTKRQKELYQLVLETQEYIAQLAGPGYWLNNAQQPEKSLHHQALKFLKDRGGYDKYFIHGIGHFLGMDVHDVGDISQPLKDGDVITIEPGIYIPNENIGIRIEDDYWVVKDGVMCLSQDLPKDIDTIEEMAQADLTSQEEEYDDQEDNGNDSDRDYDFNNPEFHN